MGDFDASAAAGRALGDMVDETADAADAATDAAADAATGGDGGGSEGDSDGSVLHSLLFAPERGPTQPVLVAKGIGEDVALIIDGTVDWVLDVVGADAADELDGNLGPLGKMAIGTGGLLSADGDESERVQDSDDGGDDVGDGPDQEVGALVDGD